MTSASSSSSATPTATRWRCTSRTGPSPTGSSPSRSVDEPRVWESLRDQGRPPHIGVLLDNTPEYVFWLGAAALTRSVVVGINATYRGDELARLITHSDCQLVISSGAYGELLDAAPTGLGADRVLRTDHPDHATELDAVGMDRESGPRR